MPYNTLEKMGEYIHSVVKREGKDKDPPQGFIDTFVDGKRCKSTPYVDGKIHGKERTWFRNGRISSETSYKEGRMHGVRKVFHFDGSLSWSSLYRNGVPFRGEIFWGERRQENEGQKR